MSDLLPCPSCARHVRVEMRSCPFCASEIGARSAPSRSFVKNAGRAAIFYLGATIAGCGGETVEPEQTIVQPYGAPPDPQPDPDGPDGPQIPEEAIAAPYGAPPMDPPPQPPPIEAHDDPPPQPPEEPDVQPPPRRHAPETAPVPAYGGPGLERPEL